MSILDDLRREREDDQGLPHSAHAQLRQARRSVERGKKRRKRSRWPWFLLLVPMLACESPTDVLYDLGGCPVWEVESELSATDFVASLTVDQLNNAVGDGECVIIYVYNPVTGKFGRTRWDKA